jgi:thiol-disulfide isomerase/thioredoxin
MLHARAAFAVVLCFLTAVDCKADDEARPRRRARPGDRIGEVITPPARDERVAETLKVGDPAPDFTLPRAANSEEQVTLSSFREKKPVVLVFGSISCPPFRRQIEQVDELYERYKDRAEFFMVYVREAHPDSKIFVKPATGNDEVLQTFGQTDDLKLRTEHAQICSRTLELSMPLLVDKPDNAVNRAYAGWPIRIAVVDGDGKLAHYSSMGPRGFRPQDLEAWLKVNLD